MSQVSSTVAHDSTVSEQDSIQLYAESILHVHELEPLSSSDHHPPTVALVVFCDRNWCFLFSSSLLAISQDEKWEAIYLIAVIAPSLTSFLKTVLIILAYFSGFSSIAARMRKRERKLKDILTMIKQ